MYKANTDVKALRLASRFALPPNSLGYCGKGSAPEKFKSCIIDGDCGGVEDEISKFIVFHPYLKTISEITGLPEYSLEVVEAYTIGNDLLKRVKLEHYELLLENFADQGVPEWLIEELRENPPQKFIPTHLFQVLHVGVGKASGSVEFNLETINNCMFRWGDVSKISDEKVEVKLNSLKKTKSGYELTQLKEEHPYKGDLVPGLKVGDTAAVHWNQVVKKLSKSEIDKLEFWTNEVLTRLYS